jgi:hypothetical protein
MSMCLTEMLKNEYGFIPKVVAAAMTMADRLAEGINEKGNSTVLGKVVCG